jgi:hypothetical protein
LIVIQSLEFPLHGSVEAASGAVLGYLPQYGSEAGFNIQGRSLRRVIVSEEEHGERKPVNFGHGGLFHLVDHSSHDGSFTSANRAV